jgi:hypothetical protein
MPSVPHRRSKYLTNPRPELSPADPAPRAGDETLQVDPARRNDSCPRSAASRRTFGPVGTCFGGRLPTGDGRPLRGLGQDVSSKPRLITPNHHIGQLGWVKLTMPSSRRRKTRTPTVTADGSPRRLPVRRGEIRPRPAAPGPIGPESDVGTGSVWCGALRALKVLRFAVFGLGHPRLLFEASMTACSRSVVDGSAASTASCTVRTVSAGKS